VSRSSPKSVCRGKARSAEGRHHQGSRHTIAQTLIVAVLGVEEVTGTRHVAQELIVGIHAARSCCGSHKIPLFLTRTRPTVPLANDSERRDRERLGFVARIGGSGVRGVGSLGGGFGERLVRNRRLSRLSLPRRGRRGEKEIRQIADEGKGCEIERKNRNRDVTGKMGKWADESWSKRGGESGEGAAIRRICFTLWRYKEVHT